MFDFILRPATEILAFFYALVPNYAIAIVLMTLLVMVVTTPLTLKGTRSMIKLQLLQPELKRIQQEHKGDRQTLNEEMMKFYQENQVNPVGGCLPLLVQMPVFLVLFRVIRGLTGTDETGFFAPTYLESGRLYDDLVQSKEMNAFGLDLHISTTDALRESILGGLPYLGLILVMMGASYYQQRQTTARNPDGAAALPQQQMLLRVMPIMFAVFSIGFPAALVVYWVTSSLFRIGVQAYITRTLYAGEDSLGAQAAQASKAARAMNDKDKAGGGKGTATKDSDKAGAGDKAKSGGKPKRPPTKKPQQPPKPLGSGRATGRATPKQSAAASKPHPSSKKKKNRKRR